MWITTLDGYFSIVHYPDHGADNLVIRARSRSDLEALARRMPELGPIKDTPAQDYPARATAPRDAVGWWLANEAMRVDYPNFKAQVAMVQGKHRAHVYGQVWATLLGIEPVDPFVWQKQAHDTHAGKDLFVEGEPVQDLSEAFDPMVGASCGGMGSMLRGDGAGPRAATVPPLEQRSQVANALDELCKQVAARVPYVIDHPVGGTRILAECFPFEGQPDLNMPPGLVFADTFWATNDSGHPLHAVGGTVSGEPPEFTLHGILFDGTRADMPIRQIGAGDPMWPEWLEWLQHMRANPDETTENAKKIIDDYSW